MDTKEREELEQFVLKISTTNIEDLKLGKRETYLIFHHTSHIVSRHRKIYKSISNEFYAKLKKCVTCLNYFLRHNQQAENIQIYEEENNIVFRKYALHWANQGEYRIALALERTPNSLNFMSESTLKSVMARVELAEELLGFA